MRQSKITRQVNYSDDMHLKNIFVSNSYLELGIIDIDVITRLLSYQIINLNDIVYFSNQNKGLGSIDIDNDVLRNYSPHFFFLNFYKNQLRYELVITYGLLKYRNEAVDNKEKFMPVFLIPIKLFYENSNTSDHENIEEFDSMNSLKVQMTGKPFLNPLCQTVFATQINRISFIQTLNLVDIQALDYALETISKLEEYKVTIVNYLTYILKQNSELNVSVKKQAQVRTDKTYYGDLFYKEKHNNYYLSKIWTIEQRAFLDRAVSGENLVLSGVNGTGKTSVLKDVIVNNLKNNKKVLYISNNDESIKDVYDFLKEKNLDRYTVNLNGSFDKINDMHFDDLFLKDVTEPKDELKLLQGYYEKLEKYQKDLNGVYQYYKVTELIGNYYLSNHDLLTAQNRAIIDDISGFDKIKYEIILESLISLEENFKKIKTFKNSIWNAIPIVNSIESKEKVLDVITKLKEQYIKIRQLEVRLFEFGVNDLVSFSDLQIAMEPLLKTHKEDIPETWRKSKQKYKEAIKKLDNLVSDIGSFDKLKYEIDEKYSGILYVNIEQEIKYLYGKFYKETDNDIINKVIKDKAKLNKIIIEGKICIKDFFSSSEELSNILNWNILDKDDYVNVVKKINDICNKYIINGQMLLVVLSKNSTNDIIELNSLHSQIMQTIEDMDKYKKEFPILTHIDFNKKDIKIDSQEVQQYDRIFKKYKKISREYLDKCGVSYHSHENNLKAISEIKDLYEEIKAKRYRKIVCDYIQSIDESKYIEFLVLSNKFLSSFNSITKLLDRISVYKYKYNVSEFKGTVDEFGDYISYLETLYESNSRIYNTIVNKVLPYPVVSDYYDIKEYIDKYNSYVDYFASNKEYPNLYGYLYNGEKTDIRKVEDIAKVYHEYISSFVNESKVYQSFDMDVEFRYVVDNIKIYMDDTVDELNNYNKMFKDGTNRYYYSNIESNVEYLSSLIDSEEELILYLNITKEINKLNKYGLSKIMSFIENNDDISQISDIFTAVYFDTLVKEYFKGKDYLTDTDKFIDLLAQIKISEDYICKCMASKTINTIIQKNPIHLGKVKKYKSVNYNSYLFDNSRRIKVYLSSLDFALDHLSLLNYDLVIIDDAHLIASGNFTNLFKDKQYIISGDFQNTTVSNSDLLSKSCLLMQNKTLFRYRFELLPSTLDLENCYSPYYTNIDYNNGIDIIDGTLSKVVEYIYNVYKGDNKVKINVFIKPVDTQRELFDLIVEYFSKNGVSSDEVIYFINNNLFISDLSFKHYYKADYNILNLEDYAKEDVDSISSNYISLLSQAHKKLIIYDHSKDLLKVSKSNFVMKLTELINKPLFLDKYSDPIIDKMSKNFIKKKYDVFYPRNDINLIIKKKDGTELIGIVNLFSNYNLFRILDIYRALNEQFSMQNQKILFTVYTDLIEKKTKYEDLVINKINKL